MTFYRHNWYYVGAILFAALSFVMGFWGNHLSQIQVILVFSFMAMLAHQFEEYAYPGGFPRISNIGMFHEKKAPDRYPLNANQCLISNVFLTYPFYIAAIVWPNLIWLGLAQVMLGMIGQSIAHIIVENIRLRSLYNPGVATVVFLHLPIGIYYVWYVTTNHLASTGDFVLGFIGMIAALAVLFVLPIVLMRSRDSKYPFSEAEMGRFAQHTIGNS